MNKELSFLSAAAIFNQWINVSTFAGMCVILEIWNACNGKLEVGVGGVGGGIVWNRGSHPWLPLGSHRCIQSIAELRFPPGHSDLIGQSFASVRGLPWGSVCSESFSGDSNMKPGLRTLV